MQHLSYEELARLVGEAPTRDERIHLGACEACRAELEAMRAQTTALAELPPRPAPEHLWPILAARMKREGLVAAERRSPHGGPALLRAAVYVGLFAAGGVLGAFWTGRGAPAGPLSLEDSEQVVHAAGSAGTPEQAADRIRTLENAYLVALDRYSELTESPRGGDPAARLAALEGILLSTRAALEAAPADPIINGYYLTAVGQRDAVLRQIARTSEDPWF